MLVRKKIFTREITVEAYEEDDGTVTIEGNLRDTMPIDAGYFRLGRRPADRRAPGVLHGLRVRWRLDRETREIIESDGEFPDPPWGGCPSFLPRLGSLAGLKPGPGFTQAMTERVGKHLGCTHAMSVLTQMLRAPWGTYYIAPHVVPGDGTGREVGPPAAVCHMHKAGGPVDTARAKGIDVFAEDW
jgi:hypothetical protein